MARTREILKFMNLKLKLYTMLLIVATYSDIVVIKYLNLFTSSLCSTRIFSSRQKFVMASYMEWFEVVDVF